jgi:hypothetical protein
MRMLRYLLLAALALLVGTMGADVAARTGVAGDTVEEALAEHLRWWSVGSTLYLFAPFFAVGLISALVDKWVSARSAVLMFAGGTLPLLYFYFVGYQDAQQALLDEKWTAAALAVGLLPVIAGVPVLLLLLIAAALAVVLHARKST